jgi:hypothetical protein
MIDTLQEFALLADIISVIAIVISLIFVGLQIKSKTIPRPHRRLHFTK